MVNHGVDSNDPFLGIPIIMTIVGYGKFSGIRSMIVQRKYYQKHGSYPITRAQRTRIMYIEI